MQSATASDTDQLAVKHSQIVPLAWPFLCLPPMGQPPFYGGVGGGGGCGGLSRLFSGHSTASPATLTQLYRALHLHTVGVDGQDAETRILNSVLQCSSSILGCQGGPSFLTGIMGLLRILPGFQEDDRKTFRWLNIKWLLELGNWFTKIDNYFYVEVAQKHRVLPSNG